MTSFTNIKGSFWSWEVRERQLSGIWPTQVGTRSGWAIAGTTANKLDFSSETLSSIPVTIANPRSGLAGAAPPGSQYGWFAGGWAGSPATVRSTIDRFSYNAQSSSGIPAVLSVSRQELASSSNNTSGWFVGGRAYFNTTTYSTIDKLNFSQETVTTPSAKLSESKFGTGSATNDNFAWFAGGERSSVNKTSSIDKLAFATDTVSVIPGKLSLARDSLAGVANQIQGWFAGGYSLIPGGSATESSTIDRLTFSTDTASLWPSTLTTVGRVRLNSVYNETSGWFMGGTNVPGATSYSVIDRITLSTGSIARSPANMSGITARFGTVNSLH